MQLPALKNCRSCLARRQSIEDYIRNSTQNLQHVAAAMPGSGSGITGAVYLGFNGNTGNWKLNKEVVDPKSLGRILVPQHGLFEGMIEWANGSPLQKMPAAAARRSPRRADVGARCCRSRCRPAPTGRTPTARRYMLGFVGFMLRRRRHRGVRALLGGRHKSSQRPGDNCPQALVAFGEIVHPVIELGSSSYENCLSDDLRPEVQRDRLRHRQAGTGGRRHLRRGHHHPADGIAGQAAPRGERSSGPLTST